jgi:hypothetical protein
MAERAAFREQASPLLAALGRADRGLSAVGRVASPPVLAAVGVVLALALGRRGTGRLLAAGLAAAGALVRLRGLRSLVARLGSGQSVSRSR